MDIELGTILVNALCMFKPDTGVDAYSIRCVLSFPKYCDIRRTLTLSTIVRRSDST